MAEEKLNRADCIALLAGMHARLTEAGEHRYPRRSDFTDREVVAIKAFLGPWPRALEAAGVKLPRDDDRAAKNGSAPNAAAMRPAGTRHPKPHRKTPMRSCEVIFRKRGFFQMKIASIKKSLAVMMAAAALLTLSVMTVSAADEINVYVNLSDARGDLVLQRQRVTVTDFDDDGALTVADALYAAHEAHFDGGAEDGFACSMGEYGLKIDKLWGTDNGGAYGYCVNHVSAMSLADPVANGDTVSAYFYTDLTAWSDTYCFFTEDVVEAKAGDFITLTLKAAGYDENWNPVTLPVEGAVITLNGERTEFVTAADGTVTVTIPKGRWCYISAVSDTQTLVPPVCVATMEGFVPVVPILLGCMAAAAAVAVMIAFAVNRKKKA